MVAVAQLAEHKVVVLGVAGSSPVSHPFPYLPRSALSQLPAPSRQRLLLPPIRLPVMVPGLPVLLPVMRFARRHRLAPRAAIDRLGGRRRCRRREHNSLIRKRLVNRKIIIRIRRPAAVIEISLVI